MGENEYNSKTDAQDGALTEILSLTTGSLPTVEFVPVATLIVQCADAYTNTYNARLVSTADGGDFVDFRQNDKIGAGTTTNHHGNLTGLTEDDHTQYLLVDGTRSMTGDLDMGGYDITSETKCWDFDIINPNGVYAKDTQVFIAVAKSALTITKIQVSLDSSSYNVAGDLKYADAFIGLANPTVINDFDTTSGVRTDTTITSGSVAAGKVIYLDFDSQPDSNINQMHVHIEWDYD